MRREFIQVIAVFAIAFGAGLFAFGRHFDPPVDSANPVAMERAMHVDDETHAIASLATGMGVCLMTFGALSLAIPWINVAVAKRCERTEMSTV